MSSFEVRVSPLPPPPPPWQQEENSRATKLYYSWFVFSQHHSFAEEIRV
jgi:hypothetical protein